MIRVVLLIVFLLTNYLLYSQSKRDYVWIFASNSDTLPGIEGSIVEFFDQKRTVRYEPVDIRMGTNNAIISDEEGNLLCYCNGCAVMNRNHILMENGDSINPGDTHDESCEILSYPGVQKSILLPNPGNSSIYYYVHTHVQVIYEPEIEVENRLYYTLIDMSENDGEGKVIEKNIPIYTKDVHFSGYLTACLHSNGKDWWLFRVKRNSNLYYKILLDGSGVSIVDSFNIGPTLGNISSGGGGKVYLALMDSYTSPMTSVMIFSSMTLIVAQVISAISGQ